MSSVAQTFGGSVVLFLSACLTAGGAEPRAEPAPWVTHPFNGKNLDGWKANPSKNGENLWRVGKAEVDPNDPKRLVVKEDGSDLVNVGVGQDLLTEARYGDCRIEIEVMVPKGSNSGIYVMGKHEVQVLDGLNERAYPKGNMGAIYGVRGPSYFPAAWLDRDWRDKECIAWLKSDEYAKCVAKVLKQPGEWQKFVIEFQLGKSDPTTKQTTPARFVRVELNGVLIHDNFEMERGARSPGPLYLQGNHGPVAYRNIKITPLGSDKKEPTPGETKP